MIWFRSLIEITASTSRRYSIWARFNELRRMKEYRQDRWITAQVLDCWTTSARLKVLSQRHMVKLHHKAAL